MMKRENIIYVDSWVKLREVYIAPVIETVEIKVEKGFQITSPESERNADEYTW